MRLPYEPSSLRPRLREPAYRANCAPRRAHPPRTCRARAPAAAVRAMPPKKGAAAAAAADDDEHEEEDEEEGGAPATGLGKLHDLNLSGALRSLRCLRAAAAARMR